MEPQDTSEHDGFKPEGRNAPGASESKRSELDTTAFSLRAPFALLTVRIMQPKQLRLIAKYDMNNSE